MRKQAKKYVVVQTKYGKHVCLFEPDDKEGYVVTVPGLPGTVTWGKTTTAAKKMAQEAIELCVECLAHETFLSRKKAAKGFVKSFVA